MVPGPYLQFEAFRELVNEHWKICLTACFFSLLLVTFHGCCGEIMWTFDLVSSKSTSAKYVRCQSFFKFLVWGVIWLNFWKRVANLCQRLVKALFLYLGILVFLTFIPLNLRVYCSLWNIQTSCAQIFVGSGVIYVPTSRSAINIDCRDTFTILITIYLISASDNVLLLRFHHLLDCWLWRYLCHQYFWKGMGWQALWIPRFCASYPYNKNDKLWCPHAKLVKHIYTFILWSTDSSLVQVSSVP